MNHPELNFEDSFSTVLEAPPDRSTSAPPALEIQPQNVFAFTPESKFANIFADIRANEVKANEKKNL
jgi:hypothetical protein